MNQSNPWVAMLAAAWGAGSAMAATERPIDPSPDPVAAAVADVNSQAPKTYPETVALCLDLQESAELSVGELLARFDSWNPAAREVVAMEFARRGHAVIPTLLDAAKSDHLRTRIGAGRALYHVLSVEILGWQSRHPKAESQDEVRALLVKKYAQLEPTIIALLNDDERAVRWTGVYCCRRLQSDSPKVARALLERVWEDDVNLANFAMTYFGRWHSIEGIDKDFVAKSLAKAMTNPYPRGKEGAVNLILSLDEPTQRKMIPVLIAHLDWQPMHDTMYGQRGQAEALLGLTRLRATELIPRIPALMTKSMRGPGLFEPSIEAIYAFGKDCKPIVPQLKAYAEKLKASLPNAHPRHKPGIQRKIDKLNAAIEHIETDDK